MIYDLIVVWSNCVNKVGQDYGRCMNDCVVENKQMTLNE